MTREEIIHKYLHLVKYVAGRISINLPSHVEIHDLVNESMSKAAAVHATDLGVDPRSLPMVAFGGAGPVHAYGIARKLGIKRVICPTGAGVTSGIDFALALVAEMVGPELARSIQLQMEYDPQPPFDAGSPRTAPSDLVAATRTQMADFLEHRRAATRQAAARLRLI